MSAESTPRKKLSDLRVIDLKQELEKRGLEKTGVKAALLERLKKALEVEGQDPENLIFDLSSTKKSKLDESMQDETEEASDKKEDEIETLDAEDLEDVGIDIGDFDNELLEDSSGEQEDSKKKVELVDETSAVADKDLSNDLSAPLETSAEDQKAEINVGVHDNGVVKVDETEEGPDQAAESMQVEEIPPEVTKDAAENEAEDMKQEDYNKENLLGSMDSEPPTPTSVPPIAAFTSNDTIQMDTSGDRKEDDISLIVHVDESQNEFDMPDTPAKSTVTDDNSNAGSVSVDISESKIEEKAALDAEKDFENHLSSSHGDGNNQAPGEDSKAENVKDGNTEMETPMEDNQAKTGSAPKDDSSVTKETSGDSKDATPAAKKPDVKSKGSINSRNLWISGLSTSTRATDLKALFSKYGKVAGAKVVTNARSPGSRCYGFVSMNTAEEASKCIQYLHRTELHGRMISVERAKTDPSQAKAIAVSKKHTDKPVVSKSSESQKENTEEKTVDKDKKEGEKVGDKKEQEKKEEKKSTDTRRHSSGDRRHSHGNRAYRKRSRSPARTTSRNSKKEEPKKATETKKEDNSATEKEGEAKPSDKKEDSVKTPDKKADDKKETDAKRSDSKPKDKDMLSLDKIKEERERERMRQRERRLREEERRRREVVERERLRQREIMQRQREESVRLQRERERLKLERERLEREKLEAEREKIRLERERRERERQELAEQRRLEALRYEEKQRNMKRPFDGRGGDDYWAEPKRATYEQREGRYNDFDSRQQPGYGGEGYQDRRADKYDRNTARTGDRENQRNYDGRRDDHRPGQNRDRRDVVRRDQPPPARDRDDRYNKYESERETRRDAPARDHDRREQRRMSPHRNPPRQSPAARRNDPPSANYRGGPNDRPGRDRGHDSRGNADRTYSGHGDSQHSSGSNWQSGAVGSGPRDNKDNRSYNRGGSSHGGNAPGNSGIIVNHHKPVGDATGSSSAGNWATADRRPAHVMVQPATDPRWTNVTSVAPRTVVNSTPMLQVQPAPATNAFLASAANIMMGVGLAQRGGDARYDAYKGMPPNLRRY